VTSPGWLYLVSDVDRGLLQVGITNHPEQRLDTHRRNRWIVLDVVGPMDGVITKAWERDILRALRADGALVGRKIGQKFDGYTESWIALDHSVASVQELMDLVRNQEEP
jgi:hypothetical protein